jgi:hypothetical protein
MEHGQISREIFCFIAGGDSLKPLMQGVSGELFLSHPTNGYVVMYRIRDKCFQREINESIFLKILEMTPDEFQPEQILAFVALANNSENCSTDHSFEEASILRIWKERFESV